MTALFVHLTYILCIIPRMLLAEIARHNGGQRMLRIKIMQLGRGWRRFVRLPHGFVSGQHPEGLRIRPKMPHPETCT